MELWVSATQVPSLDTVPGMPLEVSSLLTRVEVSLRWVTGAGARKSHYAHQI